MHLGASSYLIKINPNGLGTNMNLVAQIKRKALQLPLKTAILFLQDGEQETLSLTYADLDKKARAIAAYLQSKTTKGSRVLLLFPCGIDFICAFMGCLYAGIIAVPVFCSSPEDFEKQENYIRLISKQVDVNGVLTESSLYPILHSNFPAQSFAKEIFLTDSSRFMDCSILYNPPKIDAETIAYLQFTSGSTSEPKAAIIRHGMLAHNIKYSGMTWHYSKKSISLTWSPHAHVYGLVCSLLVPLFHGSLAIIMPTQAFLKDPLAWLRNISRYKVTHTGCPNFGYELCLRELNEELLTGLNLKSWKVAVNGGEHIKLETLFQFAQKFKSVGFKLNTFSCAYGMSEMAGTIALGRYRRKPYISEIQNNGKLKTRSKHIAVGIVLPGIDVRIVNPETMMSLAEGKVGEILLSSKYVAKGYWQATSTDQNNFDVKIPGCKKKYFKTGDLGFIKNKELFITGRLKDVIIRHGKKYYPHDLELTLADSLQQYPLGNQIIFSLLNDNVEQIIVLQEVSSNLSATDCNRVSYTIRLALLKNWGLDIQEVILIQQQTLPRTTSGKLIRNQCKQQYLDKSLLYYQQDGEEAFVTTVSLPQTLPSSFSNEATLEWQEVLASVLKRQVQDINLDAPLSEFGLDSINIVQIISAINKRYNLNIKPNTLYEYPTFGAFFLDQCPQPVSAQPQQQEEYPVLTMSSASLPDVGSYKNDDIAVIGMNGVLPGANNLEQFWQNLIQGIDVIQRIPNTRWLNEDSEPHYGGLIEGIDYFDAPFFNITPREAELTDPQQRLLLEVVWNTIEDAGYAITQLAEKKVGLFVGAFSHDYAELLHRAGVVDAYMATGITHSMLANRISYYLNLSGPSEVIDTACSSSLVALHHAIRAIQLGDCELAIVAGVNALLSPTSYAVAHQASMLSLDGKCKTFDQAANGYVRSEGVGAILLKPLSSALQDRDNIHGVIKGSAINHGGHVSALTVPNPNAQADVIALACNRAGINPQTISYIEAHGTGTAIGDPIEVEGLKKAFKALGITEQHTGFCALGSVKTHIGHLEAAAGMAGLLKVLLCMKYQKLPGNLHFQQQNSYIDIDQSPFYFVTQTTDWVSDNNQKRRAGLSSFGFGGTNAHVILEEGFTTPLVCDTQADYLFLLSAKTAESVTKKVELLLDWILKNESGSSLDSISYTLAVGREHFSKRLAIVAQTSQELIEALRAFLENKISANVLYNSTPKQTQPLLQEHCTELLANLVAQATLDNQYRKKLLVLGNFYTEGYFLNWSELFKDAPTRCSLPTYPFEKHRYWIPRIELEPQLFKAEKLKEKPLDLESALTDHISALMKIDADRVALDTPLSDFGLDSLAFKDLAQRLQEAYQTPITPALFYNHQTIAAISQYLKNQKITHALPQTNLIALNKENKNNSEWIAVIGMQAYLPQSEDLNEFWQHLLAGNDLVSEVPEQRWDWREHWGDDKTDPTKTVSKWGGFLADIDQFDAAFFNISSREANLMDPQQRLLMEVVWKTIEDAGYDPLALEKKKVGLFVGAEFAEYQTLIQSQRKVFHGHISTGNSHAMLANRISYFLNLKGPSEVIQTACSSSLVAVNRALGALRNGECTMAIVSGVSLNLSPDTFIITSQLGALSPDGRCKTFDESANGYVKGEGVAALLLKPLSLAQQEGDHIYGVIKACAVNHGGKAQSLTAPNVEAQGELLINAYQQAKIDPSTVTYIETHGTGTELGDPVEVEGLKQAFRSLLPQTGPLHFCGLGSVKTNVGHLEPASGLVGMIKVLLAMQHGVLPGMLHFKKLNPYISLQSSPFYLVEQTQPWQRLIGVDGVEIPRRAGVSSFGFGGTCAHVVLEEYISLSATPISDKPCYLITLSAKHIEGLSQKASALLAWLEQHQGEEIDLTALSYTLNAGRGQFGIRTALIISNTAELIGALTGIIEATVTPWLVSESQGSTLIGSSPLDYHLLVAFARRYLKGEQIDWLELYAQPRRMAGLPSYPFARKRYWFDEEFPKEAQPIPKATAKPIMLDDLNQATLNYLREIFAKKLKLNSQTLMEDETYEGYGVDSLLSVEIVAELEIDLGALPKTLLYEKNTLRDLAGYLLKTHHTQLLRALNNGESIQGAQEPTDVIEPTQITASQGSSVDSNQDIAIIGMSINFPMATNQMQLWQNLLAGRDCITEIPLERWDYRDFPVQVGEELRYFKHGGFIADVDKFDPLFFNISPREAMLMDPQERLFMQTAWQALEDAGCTREKMHTLLANQVGVFAGVTYNYYPLLIAQEWAKGNQLPLDIQTFSIANRLSYFLNVSGPSFVIDTACSSSLAAIHLACESLLRHECTMAIAGGVNLSLHPSKYHFLGGYSLLSQKGRCESFANGGDGYVPSEGIGVVLLKPLTLAKQHQDRIYGVIKSSAMNHGGKTSGYTVPNPSAQAELVKTALQKANMSARAISYIEAHGTGTALGDPIEVRGLQEAFECYTQDKQFCAIGSVKSNLGHLEAAAGISQLAKVILQLQYKKLVPSIHAQELNPYINFEQTPFKVQRTVSDWEADYPRRAGMSSFGAGGTNVHVIVEEYVDQAVSRHYPESPYLFLLSAQNEERLHCYVALYIDYLKEGNRHTDQHKWLMDMCFTLQTGREAMSARLAVLTTSYEDLLANLIQFQEDPTHQMSRVWVNKATQKIVDKVDVKPLLTSNNLEQLAHAWIKGVAVTWVELYSEMGLRCIELPTYPFAKRVCWVGTSPVAATPPVLTVSVPIADAQDFWLIFNDKELGFHLQREMSDQLIQCFANKKFEVYDHQTIYLNPSEPEHCEALLNHLASNKQGRLRGIKYLWTCSQDVHADCLQDMVPNLLEALKQRQWQEAIEFTLVLPEHMAHGPWQELFNIFSNDKLTNVSFKIITLFASESLYVQAKKMIAGETVECPVLDTLPQEQVIEPEPSIQMTKDEVLQVLVSTLANLLALEEAEIEYDVPFLNYGMDSILGINFIGKLNKTFPQMLSPMDLYRYSTLAQLSEYLAGRISPQPENSHYVEPTILDEGEFLQQIDHLSEAQINQLLEDELSELDLLLE